MKLPVQNMLLYNLNPSLQEQLKNGSVLIQLCSHPPLSLSHSLISTICSIKTVAEYSTYLGNYVHLYPKNIHGHMSTDSYHQC